MCLFRSIAKPERSEVLRSWNSLMRSRRKKQFVNSTTSRSKDGPWPSMRPAPERPDPGPPADIVQFGARHAACVSVSGYVQDLVPYLARAAVMVVPVRAASGMRVRILEALARGMPVVSTTMGVEGIEAIDGEHLLVADEPFAFTQAVVRLLDDPALRILVAAEQVDDARDAIEALTEPDDLIDDQ